MATASSAQREPSMEEILASIRRIIEDSDTGRKQPGDADEFRQDLAPAAGPAADVDAFRAELRSGVDARKPVTLAEVQAQLAVAEPVTARKETPVHSVAAPAAARGILTPTAVAPKTLAEVSARIAAEPGPATGADKPATARSPETADAIVADWRREIAAAGEPAKTATVTKPHEIEMRRASDADPEVDIFEGDLTDEPAFESTPSRSGPARQAGEIPPARPAILSERTGRQVAAAFGELSDAFASRSKKTFDEMAEEMLRPMLQDWLDNNLPTLVERLVREEIERVARGAQ